MTADMTEITTQDDSPLLEEGEEREFGDSRTEFEEVPNLNGKNYINLLSFFLNVTLTYVLGVSGVNGIPTNTEISAKYQTLITPPGWAFSVWVLIFVYQAAFAVTQLMPTLRASPAVQDGVAHWYAFACAWQIGWTVAFSAEALVAALVLILGLLASLVALLASVRRATPTPSVEDKWLVKSPFLVWTGWIVVAAILNANVLSVARGARPAVQLAESVLSLTVLYAIALVFTFFRERPSFIVPLLCAWATGSVAAELKHPKPSIEKTFDDTALNGLRFASLFVCAAILAQMAGRVAFRCLQWTYAYYCVLAT